MYTHTLHIKQIKKSSEIVKQAKWDTWGIKHTALHVYEQHSLSRTPPKQVLIKQEGEVEVANARLTVPIKWEREKKAVMKDRKTTEAKQGQWAGTYSTAEGAWLFLLWDLKCSSTSSCWV